MPVYSDGVAEAQRKLALARQRRDVTITGHAKALRAAVNAELAAYIEARLPPQRAFAFADSAAHLERGAA